MTELSTLSITNLAQRIRAKTISCREVMASYFATIRQVNPKINAIVQLLDEEKAMQQADAADEMVAKGVKLGVLHGMPITVKDHLKVKDFIVTCGSTGLKNYHCQEDASIVSRLKQAGGIVIGITNMPEFGCAFESDNDVYGQSKNPYDLTRTPGGSSGGEAAILASGGSVLGIGSDGAGSIRLPAHFCGIAGIKPTQHLVPFSGGVPADGGMPMLFCTPGPMARFVEDLKIALPIMAGWDGVDPYVLPASLTTVTKPVKELRVGYIIENSACIPDQDIIATMENAIKVLRDNIPRVTQMDGLDVGYISKFHLDTFFYGGDQGKGYRQQLNDLNVKKCSVVLQKFLAAAEKSEIFDATEIRRRFFAADQLRIQALQQMQQYDVIIAPAFATCARTHGTTQLTDSTYLGAFNLLGWPVCVVRCGESSAGLPIGLQIIAKPWDDYLTLTVAELLQNHLGGWKAPKRLG